MEGKGYQPMPADISALPPPPSYHSALHDASGTYPTAPEPTGNAWHGYQADSAAGVNAPYPTNYPTAPFPATYPTAPNPPSAMYPPPPHTYQSGVQQYPPYPPSISPADSSNRSNQALIADTVVIVPGGNGTTVTATEEQPDATWNTASFTDQGIRRGFIRKVFLILMTQLAVTVGVIALFIFCKPVKDWVQTSGMWFYVAAYLLFLIMYIVLVCCPSVRRSWPGNIICLAIFTLALSYMAGTISSFHDTEIVLIAMAITCGVCLSLTIFAIQTKINFTILSGCIFAVFMVLIFFALACIIGGAFMNYAQYYILNCVYAGIAALLFSLFLVYDVHMVMGGSKYSLSPEEYIFGALQIYLDIVYLFLIILSLFGGRK